LKIIKDPNNVVFMAVDGEHLAEIKGDEVRLKMQDVTKIGERGGFPFLHSGTAPHNILYVEDIFNYPVVEEGRRIRYLDTKGTNVDFVEIKNGIFNVRTYERGIEDETLACGTGASCVAVCSHYLGKLKENVCYIKMPGGDLKIEFEKKGEKEYKNIWLTGPVKCVFKGKLSI